MRACHRVQARWPDAAAVAGGVYGTPFGPLVHALPAEQRERYEAQLQRRFTPEEAAGPVHRQTASVIARAVA